MKLFCITPWNYNSDQKHMTGFSFQIDFSVVNKMHMLKNELLCVVYKRHTYSYKKIHMYASKSRSFSPSCCYVLISTSTSYERFVEESCWLEKEREKKRKIIFRFWIWIFNAMFKSKCYNKLMKTQYSSGIYNVLKPSWKFHIIVRAGFLKKPSKFKPCLTPTVSSYQIMIFLVPWAYTYSW